MAFTLDNQTLLYIIIALFIVNFFVMTYYVKSSIEGYQQENNKKLVKKLTGQIGSTFEQYMGKNKNTSEMVSDPRHANMQSDMRHEHMRGQINRKYSGQDMDSINDPADDIEDPDYPQNDQDPRNDMTDEPQDNESYE